MTPIPFPDRQLPVGDEVFLDHVAWMTSDMDRASAAFERLGFILTPYSVHGNRDPVTGEMNIQGSANRLAMLERGYVEILAAVDGVETSVAGNIRQSLGRYEGLHLVAFSVADADADFARLEDQGVPLQPLVHLRRQVEAADGGDAEVAFSVIRPAFGAFPEGRMQLLSHHTPDHMWQDRYVARENHLVGLTEVVICVDDPRGAAASLADLTRTPISAENAGGTMATLDFSRGRVRYVTPGALKALIPGAEPPSMPFMAALGMQSRDLGATERFFADRRIITSRRSDGAMIVDKADGLGCYVIVHA